MAVPLSPESLSQIWPEFLRQAGPVLAGFLQKAGAPAISGPNTLVLRFNAPYNSEREYCSDPARLARMQEVLRRLTGQPCQVRVESAGGPPPSSPGPPGEPVAMISPYRRQRAEASQEPLLKRAIEMLGAQIVQVDDGFGGAPAAAAEADRPESPDVEEA